MKLARRIVEQLNKAGASKLVPSQPQTIQEYDAQVDETYNRWLDEQSQQYGSTVNGVAQVVLSSHGKPQTMGYVTKDACPGTGDDIEHIPCKSADPCSFLSADKASASISQTAVSIFAESPLNLTSFRDFISTPFPDGLTEDHDLDVIVMDFALDDFCLSSCPAHLKVLT